MVKQTIYHLFNSTKMVGYISQEFLQKKTIFTTYRCKKIKKYSVKQSKPKFLIKKNNVI